MVTRVIAIAALAVAIFAAVKPDNSGVSEAKFHAATTVWRDAWQRHEQMFQDSYFCPYEIGKRNLDLEDIKDCLAEQSQ